LWDSEWLHHFIINKQQQINLELHVVVVSIDMKEKRLCVSWLFPIQHSLLLITRITPTSTSHQIFFIHIYSRKSLVFNMKWRNISGWIACFSFSTCAYMIEHEHIYIMVIACSHMRSTLLIMTTLIISLSLDHFSVSWTSLSSSSNWWYICMYKSKHVVIHFSELLFIRTTVVIIIPPWRASPDYLRDTTGSIVIWSISPIISQCHPKNFARASPRFSLEFISVLRLRRSPRSSHIAGTFVIAIFLTRRS
jgi:hypothetical protein